MRSNPTRGTLTALALATAAILAPQAALAQSEWGPCPGMGPGKAGAPGAERMHPGMGPQGMGGPHGMGPGMGQGMHGRGPGQGPMPGMGGGPGGPAATFGLSEEQAGEMRRLSEELRKEHWDLMGRMMDKRAELQELYAEDRPDPEAVGEAYEEMAKLRREMIEGRIELQNRMFDLLSEEQRERMKQSRERAAPAPGAAEGSGYGQPGRGYGPGPAMPGPAMAPGAGPGHGMGPEGPGQAMMGRPSDMSGQPAAGPGEVPEGEGQPPAEVEVE